MSAGECQTSNKNDYDDVSDAGHMFGPEEKVREFHEDRSCPTVVFLLITHAATTTLSLDYLGR